MSFKQIGEGGISGWKKSAWISQDALIVTSAVQFWTLTLGHCCVMF